MKRNFNGAIAAGAAATALLIASPMALAWDNVLWSVNIGTPGVMYPAYPAPFYSQPIPVYSQPVYSQPQPVYVTPAPVYYLNSPQPYYWGYSRRVYGYAPGYGPSYRQGWYDRRGYRRR